MSPGAHWAGDEPNGPAVTGFWVSVASVSLLVLSFGLLSAMTVFGGAVGALIARSGRLRIERGETTERGAMARAGVAVGAATVGLSIAALAAWIVVLARHG